MFRGRIVVAILFLLLVVGLLSVAGYVGWSQGYTAGIIAADGGDGSGAPLPYGRGFYPGPFYGFGFFPLFFGFGLFFRIGFFILLLFLFARLFSFWGWRMAGGPPGYGRGRHWHHGPPPWTKEGQEDTAGTDEPEAGSEPSGAATGDS